MSNIESGSMTYYCPVCRSRLNMLNDDGSLDCLLNVCTGKYIYITTEEADERDMSGDVAGVLDYELECCHCDFTDRGSIFEVLHAFLSIDHIKETGHAVRVTFYTQDGIEKATGIYCQKVDENEDLNWFTRKLLCFVNLFPFLRKKKGDF